MAKHNNIVHQYFKKESDEATILVKVNPIHFAGAEVIIYKSGEIDKREIVFDEHIFDDLKVDGFIDASPLEFNLYWTGLA